MSQFTNYKLILEELDHTLSHIQDEQYDRFANDEWCAKNLHCR